MRLALIAALVAIPLVGASLYFVVFGNPFAPATTPTPLTAERVPSATTAAASATPSETDSTSPTPTPANESVTISGVVIYKHDDTTVNDAIVQCMQRYVMNAAAPQALTGNDGKFHLTGCPPGELSVSIEHPLMASKVVELGEQPAGAHIRDLVIEAEVGGRILGFVTDDAGPVGGARIAIFESPPKNKNIARHPHQIVTSDEEGRFETSALPYAEWQLVGATADGRTASAKTTISGSSQRAYIQLPRQQRVTGTVYADEKPVEGAEVRLLPLWEDVRYESKAPLEQRTIAHQLFGDIDASRNKLTNAKGRFEFNSVPPVPMYLTATRTKYGAGALRIDEDGDHENLYLELYPSGEIVGVIEEDGHPTTVTGIVTARSADSLFEPLARLEKGLFRLSPVPEGDWRVRVYVTGRGDPLSDRNVEVRADTTTELRWDLSELEPPP